MAKLAGQGEHWRGDQEGYDTDFDVGPEAFNFGYAGAMGDARPGRCSLSTGLPSRRTAVVRHATGVEELPGPQLVVLGRQLR